MIYAVKQINLFYGKIKSFNSNEKNEEVFYGMSSSKVEMICLGFSSFKQFKCPNGHSRLKHGLHGKFKLKIFALEFKGGVKFGSEEP